MFLHTLDYIGSFQLSAFSFRTPPPYHTLNSKTTRAQITTLIVSPAKSGLRVGRPTSETSLARAVRAYIRKYAGKNRCGAIEGGTQESPRHTHSYLAYPRADVRLLCVRLAFVADPDPRPAIDLRLPLEDLRVLVLDVLKLVTKTATHVSSCRAALTFPYPAAVLSAYLVEIDLPLTVGASTHAAGE